MSNFKKMFSCGDEISSMRALSFISLVIGSILAFIGLLRDVNPAELSLLCGVFVGSAFGGKAMQKFAERRYPPKEGAPSEAQE